MAKRNLFLGTASGKIGDIVVYRAGGTQRSRVRVTPKDARTSKQMAQRSKIGGVVVHYRAGKGLFESSFENKESKQSAYNAFAAIALPTAPYLAKYLNDAGYCSPMPFAVSRGSIPSPFINLTAGTQNGTVQIPGAFESTYLTVAAITDALMDARPCCFRNGSVLLGIKWTYKLEDAQVGGSYKPVMEVTKLKLDNESTENIADYTDMTFVGNGTSLTITLPGTEGALQGYAFIVVNEDSEGIHVTSADIKLNAAALEEYQQNVAASQAEVVAESYKADGGSCII